uniref:Uncharacterized protein n=1 Tax=Arundo donax TaxID=35708 RepID=A0A0A9CVW8_ARUDO
MCRDGGVWRGGGWWSRVHAMRMCRESETARLESPWRSNTAAEQGSCAVRDERKPVSYQYQNRHIRESDSANFSGLGSNINQARQVSVTLSWTVTNTGSAETSTERILPTRQQDQCARGGISTTIMLFCRAVQMG